MGKKKKSSAPGWHGGRKQKTVLTKTSAGYVNQFGRLLTPAEHQQLKNKGLVTYSDQYTGGRGKGRKNLTRTETGFKNQYGVEVTQAERKKLESLVNTANRKRKKMIEAEATLPRMKGGKPTGDTVATLQMMGKESDFILAQKSKSLQRFRTRADFDNYLKNLERVNSPTYIDDRTRLYKRNHMKALENAFGDDAKDVMMKIRMMKPEDYRKLIQSDEDMDIAYIYDPSERSAKLNKIRSSLGMNLKDDYDEYMEE